MTVHTAFTGFPSLAPGAMIFFTGDVALRAGDVIDLASADVAETRLTIVEVRSKPVRASEEGRADPWELELTEHGRSDFPVLIDCRTDSTGPGDRGLAAFACSEGGPMPQTPYYVTAILPNGRLSETRVARASAVVLAMKWHDLGYTGVSIAAPEGGAFSLADFRRLVVASDSGSGSR